MLHYGLFCQKNTTLYSDVTVVLSPWTFILRNQKAQEE